MCFRWGGVVDVELVVGNDGEGVLMDVRGEGILEDGGGDEAGGSAFK